jgi:hypothetical protein
MTKRKKQMASRILELNKHLNETPYDQSARSERTRLVNELCVMISGG